MKRLFLLVLASALFFACSAEKEGGLIEVATNLEFPEGPAWNGKDMLCVSNCYSTWILKVQDEETDTFVVQPTEPVNFSKTNGLAFDFEGNLVACDYGIGAIIKFDTETGQCDTLCTGYEGKKFNRPNDLAFKSNGDLYFTDPNEYGKDKKDGSVYMLPKGESKAVKIADSLAFCNGIAFSADEKYLYVCESAMNRVLKFPLMEDGTLGDFTVFAELPGGDPDGIALDVKGNLYVAHFGGKAVKVFDKEGKMIKKIDLPGKKPSNVEFAGADMKTLYITECENNILYKIKVDTPGLKLAPQRN